ncbi:AidA/PixA family protein [Sodalis sp. RH19]|uniref:AidA/PixA family protein n=1 Tax=Sodalis sp. RH19 TaxID=3394334 RepID=UPI0039B3AC3C
MALYTQPLDQDDLIVLCEDMTFSRRDVVIANLAIDVNVGDIIKVNGSGLSTSTDTAFLLVAIPQEAGANKTVTTVDRDCIVRYQMLHATNTAAVTAAMTYFDTKNIRVL